MLANRINSLTVRNYRSLADVTVELDDLTVLVGPNGSGKSNFLDVLRFVNDALRVGLDSALLLHERGGIGSLRRYSTKGRPFDIYVSISLTLNDMNAKYDFVLGSQKRNEYVVKNENCVVGDQVFRTENGKMVESTFDFSPAIQTRNLTLPLISSHRPFDYLYEFLTTSGYYSIFPNDLRLPQSPGSYFPLESSGKNFSSVLRELLRTSNESTKKELFTNLSRLIPEVDTNEPLVVMQVGSYLVTRVRYTYGGIFDLARESDGTIRLIGLLLALYQSPILPLVGIEEPELLIHPGVMGILCDILVEASTRQQILLTTHSPDLIARFQPDSLRWVERREGTTRIERVSLENKTVIEERLFTAGDLLRLGSLARG